MIKYFIENSQGEWLRDLEHPDASVTSCWTRDPFKAWTFDNDDYTTGPGTQPSLLVIIPRKQVIVLKGPRMAISVYKFLMNETGVCDLKITEQEFMEATLTSAGYHLTRTSDGLPEMSKQGITFINIPNVER